MEKQPNNPEEVNADQADASEIKRTREIVKGELDQAITIQRNSQRFLDNASQHGMVGSSFGADSDSGFTGDDIIAKLRKELSAFDKDE